MVRRALCSGLCWVGLLLTTATWAQKAGGTDVQLLAALYAETMSTQSGLINGKDYVHYESVQGEHPYFVDDEWSTGSVTYDGSYYADVDLRYDLEQDLLIYEHPYNGEMIQLVSARVSSFDLRGHRFEYLDQKVGSNTLQGFYEVVYAGTVKAWAKHSKTFLKRHSSSSYDPIYSAKSSHYLFIRNEVIRINSMGELVKAFGGFGVEARKAARKQHLNFKHQPELTMRVMAAYYDSQTR